jgi:hypothetical protein
VLAPPNGCPTFRDFRKVGTTDLVPMFTRHILTACVYATNPPCPTRLHRNYGAGYLHFITTSCYQRRPLLNSPENRICFSRFSNGSASVISLSSWATWSCLNTYTSCSANRRAATHRLSCRPSNKVSHGDFCDSYARTPILDRANSPGTRVWQGTMSGSTVSTISWYSRKRSAWRNYATCIATQ